MLVQLSSALTGDYDYQDMTTVVIVGNDDAMIIWQ